ncbi:MAG: PRC-barrel domain-containing protein [Chromatiaceae bacterium]
MKLHYATVSSMTVLALALATPGATLAAEPELEPRPSQTQTMQPESASPSGESQATYPMGGSPGTQSGREAADAGAPADLAQDLSAQDIAGKDVLNRAGEKLGVVDKVVRDPATNQLHAVLEVGGILGIGAKEVIMPLRDMMLRDDNLLAQSWSTQEELKKGPSYEASQYTELPADQVIDRGEFSAFEGVETEESPGQETSTPPGQAVTPAETPQGKGE